MSRLVLACLLLICEWVLSPAHAAPDRCATPTNGSAVPPNPSTEFKMFRPGQQLVDAHWRDLEFGWDVLYPNDLIGSTLGPIEKTLVRFAGSLVDSIGPSPLATDARGVQVINDYFRREGADWTNVPTVTPLRLGVNSFVPGVNSYSVDDRGHADLYLTLPSRHYPNGGSFGGQYPSAWNSPREDLTTGHPENEILNGNSISLDGPASGQEIDTLGTGWARPRTKIQTEFNHELQHAMPPSQNAGASTEFWSAAAEVVGGHYAPDPPYEFPYDTAFTEVYQARTGFMAYAAYNFLNADSARTLNGMRDDLLYKWAKARAFQHGFPVLHPLLSDANCATCADRQYFRPGGLPLDTRSRLGVLIHNWRVAMFADHPTLDERQYGFPAWSGFKPSTSLSAWKTKDTDATNDLVALPMVVNLTSADLGTPLEHKWTRQFRGTTRQLALPTMGAHYWVIRAGSGLTSQDRKLVLRFLPYRSLGSSMPPFQTEVMGGRVHLSAIRYNHADAGTADESVLWQHPEWIAGVTPIASADMDGNPGDLSVIVPDFGVATKAVVLVMSLSDGRNGWWGDYLGSNGVSPTEFLSNALPYRLRIELRASTDPAHVTPIAADASPRLLPAFAPDDQTLVYSKATNGSLEYRLHRRSVNGGAEQRLNLQELDQLYADVSPRGDLVAYEGYIGSGQTNLFLTPLAPTSSTNPQTLTSLDGCEFLPAFQPNGRGVAYVHASNGVFKLRWIGVDGTGDREVATLTGLGSGVQRPRWSVDGSKIYMTLPELGDRIASVPSSGGAWTVLATHDLTAVSFDLHPGAGPTALATTIPLPSADPGGSIATPRIALFTPDAARDTLYAFNRSYSTMDSPRYSHSGALIAQQAKPTGGISQVHWARATDNMPPVFNVIEDQFGLACVPLQFNLPATDPEGGALTWQAYYKPTGSQIIQGNVFRWTYPTEGVYWVLFRVMDPRGDVDTRVVQITITDDGSCEELLTGGEGGGGGGFASRGAELTTRLPGNPPGIAVSGGSFLDGASSGQWESRVASLPHSGATQAGSYLVSVEARVGAGVDLDRIRLLVVDHDPSTVALAAGQGVLVGQLATAIGATDLAGTPLALSEAAPLLMSAGESVEIDLGPNPQAIGLAVRCRRAEGAFASGLEVLAPDDESWSVVGTLRPRRDVDRLALTGPNVSRVRLRAVAPTILYDVAAVLPQQAGPMHSTTEVAPQSISGAESAGPVVLADSEALRLDQGSPRTAAFVAPALAEGATRTLLLAMTARVPEMEGLRSGLAGSEGSAAAAPEKFAPARVHPNPATGRAAIAFSLSRTGPVALDVYDLQGARVRRLVDGVMPAGPQARVWDGLDDQGRPARAGAYFVRFSAEQRTVSTRFVLLR